MKFPPSEFWSYSTRVYQIAEIEKACLNLQNQFHADVNILLYCCWVAEKQIALSEKDIDTLIKISQPWQKNILMHLRAARTTLKTSTVAIPDEQRKEAHQNICEMELNAEHMAQLALEKALNLKKKSRNNTLQPVDCTSHNLSLYCQQLDSASPVEQINEQLNIITQALYIRDDDNSQTVNTAQAGS
ncbi:MAG: TIGR02444 family protein [Gammaproteobacteria bacterium]|nr:TIGR02444 family protein [Gammaproteobacteria bacterium]MCW8909011.1 TIGR02444 family protein [Gammaproteobacteria bacterium]MCW9004368.1 TIGR02444 family protein [Gammaproteobacteria bacterium]MCW9056160.1 TIGR02444 family protein [Gammaproteobacteria bacterium]